MTPQQIADSLSEAQKRTLVGALNHSLADFVRPKDPRLTFHRRRLCWRGRMPGKPRFRVSRNTLYALARRGLLSAGPVVERSCLTRFLDWKITPLGREVTEILKGKQ
jgi:hypothetical protein